MTQCLAPCEKFTLVPGTVFNFSLSNFPISMNYFGLLNNYEFINFSEKYIEIDFKMD